MSIKKTYFVVILFVLYFSTSINAITTKYNTNNIPAYSIKDSLKNRSDSTWKPSTSVFVELLGKGFISANVDFRIKKSFAISIGNQPMEVLCPDVMLYYLGGARHRFELGGGLSLGFSNKLEVAGILYHGVIGYRNQTKKGLFFRIGFTPLFVTFLNKKDDRSNKLYPFFGLSLGYCF